MGSKRGRNWVKPWPGSRTGGSHRISNRTGKPCWQGSGGELVLKFLVGFGWALFLAMPAMAATESKTLRDWTGTCDEYACKAEVAGEGGLAMGQTGYIL